jgi:hypothetical protein
MQNKPIRELRKCLQCKRYFWTPSISTEAGSSDWAERLRYCVDCWNSKIQRPMSLEDIEAQNKEMSEADKQAEENGERYRRYRAN